ncbi:DoxX family protein [Lewinellaceae bacterium SD302]|nr:DoxX family protein [Lewinellaceae bacterium SD302]
MKDLSDLLGRILLSMIFIFEAYDYIAYAKSNKAAMTAYGLTWNQDLLLYGAITLLVLGALMLLTGYRMRFGSILLLLYWLPMTYVVHSFWNDPEEQRRLQSILFTKNLAITGGLLITATHTSGRYAIKKIFATTRV